MSGDLTLRLVAWMRLLCVGVLLSGLALATLPRFVGGDLALIASLIVLVLWLSYLVVWRWNDGRQCTYELRARALRVRVCVCVCVCVCVRARASVICVCLCVRACAFMHASVFSVCLSVH